MPGFFNRVGFTARENRTNTLNSNEQSNSQQDLLTPIILEENEYTMTSCLNLAYKLFRNNIPIVLITLYLLYKEFASCKCVCAEVYDPPTDVYNSPRENYYLEGTKEDVCPISRGYCM
jgi:hypothetical protein